MTENETEPPVIDLTRLAAETPEESLAAEHAATDALERAAADKMAPDDADAE
jgi:hypothetical protein